MGWCLIQGHQQSFLPQQTHKLSSSQVVSALLGVIFSVSQSFKLLSSFHPPAVSST